MFAFALWDRRERVLHLGRDRLGEKPLYYGWMGDAFVFASELKALRPHPAFTSRVRRDALVPYLQHGYIPTACSIYEGIYKLPPGTVLSLTSALPAGLLPEPEPYWSARRAAEAGVAQRLSGSEADVVAQLDEVLRATIRDEMVADVPLGAFLSGGVDSSTIVALMQAQSAQPVRTFTIGFHDDDFNEATHAAAVARHLGTDHTELYVTPEEALAVIPRLPALYDEPFADSSQIPTFLVAQMARRAVTVSLSGDGGDEVFAGYDWYRRGADLWRRTRKVPRALRRTFSLLLGPVARAWDILLDRLAPARLRQPLSARRIDKLSALLAHASRRESLHQWLISAHWPDLHCLVPGAVEPLSALNDPNVSSLQDIVEALQCFDMQTYLTDDILVKVDRASMGVSLEARAPFLDHRVVELAWRIPPHMKVRGGLGKWILRQLLYRYVPRELIDRPKRGFSVPVNAWLRGPLRDWAESLLDPLALRAQGYFAPDPIQRLWQEHLHGKRNWGRQLWHVLMFQAWLEAESRDEDQRSGWRAAGVDQLIRVGP
jgi:asparagine synthase (glutamine-hydrolysing)